MKKRKSVIALSIVAGVLLLASIACFVVSFVNGGDFANALVGFVNGFVSVLTDVSGSVPGIIAKVIVGVFAVLAIAWIIVDAMRKKAIVALFVLMALLGGFVAAAGYPAFDINNLGIASIAFIVAAVACLAIIVLFVVDVVTGKAKKEPMQIAEEAAAKKAAEKDEAEVVEEPVEETPVEEVKAEEVVPVVEEKKEEPKVEEKPVEKKPAAKKAEKKEPAKKEEAKKAEPAKAEKKKAEPKAKVEKKEEKPAKAEAPKAAEEKKEKDGPTKVYHVSKRAADEKWVIKFAGGEKVIKTFKTKVEAVEYADKLAASQGGIVLVHASKGKNAGRINEKR